MCFSSSRIDTKFLKPDEFAKLLKAAKDDREKCILLSWPELAYR
jgi:hypothetical protein